MTDPVRTIHFVGSYPVESADAALREMCDLASRCARAPLCLPDGETRRARLYVVPILDALTEQRALRLVRPGTWEDVWHRGRYARGAWFGGQMVLGYRNDAVASAPILRRWRESFGVPDVVPQVGMPTPVSLAVVPFGPRVLHPGFRRPFVDATRREIAAVHDEFGDGVVIQLEATLELVAVTAAELARGPYRLIADRFGRSIAALALRSPPGTRFAVHLCYGALHNKAAVRPRSTAPLVALANAITAYWPARHRLEYLHAPIAAGEWLPPLGKTYYRPLRELSLPRSTAFFAGLAHEDQPARDQFQARDLAEESLGRPVHGVAAACGLGRRDIGSARRVARRMVELTGA